MPALEMAQETGKLVSWLKKEGDTIAKGDLLLEIETDKAVMEVEAAADGILGGITGEVGTDIPVGQTIAWILAPGERIPAPAVVAAVVEAPAVQAVVAAEEKTPQAASASARISPKARRMAQEAGIDLKTVHGSGEDGEILTTDIQALIDAQIGAQIDDQIDAQSGAGTPTAKPETLSAIGRLMAERTTQSWTTVPHFFLQREVDASGLNRARAALGPGVESSAGAKLTHTDILIALVARTLATHPRLNASWVDDSIRLNAEINVSLAIAVGDGVVAPVVHGAAGLSLAEIAKQRRELTDRARSGKLRPGDFAGGTFTISNLGMFQIDSFCAIITPPQSAILAVGQIVEKVVVIAGEMAIRPMLSLTISSDHRVIDGAKAATFLKDLAEAIQAPESLLK